MFSVGRLYSPLPSPPHIQPVTTVTAGFELTLDAKDKGPKETVGVFCAQLAALLPGPRRKTGIWAR